MFCRWNQGKFWAKLLFAENYLISRFFHFLFIFYFTFCFVLFVLSLKPREILGKATLCWILPNFTILFHHLFTTSYFLFIARLNIFIGICVKYAYLKDTLCQARLKIHRHPLKILNTCFVYGDLSEKLLSGQIRRCRFNSTTSFFLLSLNHLLASGNRLRKDRWSLLQQLALPTTPCVQHCLIVAYFAGESSSHATTWWENLVATYDIGFKNRIFCRGELKSRYAVIREPCCNLVREACNRCLDIFAVLLRLSDRVSQRCTYNCGTSSVTVARQECHAWTFS